MHTKHIKNFKQNSWKKTKKKFKQNQRAHSEANQSMSVLLILQLTSLAMCVPHSAANQSSYVCT